MRIGAKDFELGSYSRVYQAVLDALPEEDEAVDYRELESVYTQAKGMLDPSFDEVLKNLEPWIESKMIGATTFYRRKLWLSTREVAHILKVSKRTVQAWHQKRLLPATRVSGGNLRFSLENVATWMSGELPSVIQGADDPVLNDLWDNDVDAGYDQL